jgi:phosphonate metabolism protein (transferase hexapeptide repeat family)
MTKLSPNPTVHPGARLNSSDLGAWTQIGAFSRIENSSFGDYSYIGEHSQVDYSSVGKFCSIASYVRLNPGNHPLERATTHHFTYRAAMFELGHDDAAFFEWRRSHSVHVGHDVWIGHNATVMAGVKIGNGAVIGAGAVVTKEVAPYSIVVGVPAKLIRLRFPDQISTKLEQLQWWNWSHDLIKVRLPDFRGDIESFLEKYGGA